MDKPLIITHGNCFDGFTAAWVCKKYFNKNSIEPDFHFAIYGEPPPDVTGRDVLMFDFSYKRPVLLEMKSKAKSLLVCDHHKTAKEDLDGLDFCAFDMDSSGAQMAWAYFFGGNNEFVDYVADRDLWRFKLPFSKEINAAIGSYPKTFQEWDYLNRNISENECGKALGITKETFIKEGTAILRYQNQCIEEIAKTAREIQLPSAFGKFAGMSIMVANCPYVLASLVGNKLAELSVNRVGCAWFQRQDGTYQYSFRSQDYVDVAEICKQIGGGGHRNAAGAESDILLV